MTGNGGDRRVALRGLAWNHERGIGPVRASIEAYRTVQPNIQVVWESRPIWRFAYAPLADMLRDYDLVLFDHPHIGTLVDGRSPMLPLDEWLPGSYLADQAQNSVGPSHASYAWNGHQWALAVDAAALVAAYRPDLIPDGLELPRHWAEVAGFAASLGDATHVALPMNFSDASVNLDTIAANIGGDGFFDCRSGFDRAILERALEILQSMLGVSYAPALYMPPLLALETMATTNDIAYMPLQFGYSNYARPGSRPNVIRFTNIPSSTDVPNGSVLGGVGLAVSASTKHPREATAYAAFLASPDFQRGGYFDGGGQPGHRRAWLDERVNGASSDFFASTLATLDRAYLRPRVADCGSWWDAQVWIGHLLAEAAARREPLTGLGTEIARVDRVLREGR